MLQLDNVSKTYRSAGQKKVIFDQFSHQFHQGIHVLKGPSGAGKSTLLRMCATAEKPNKGKISWLEQGKSKGSGFIRKHLGYAPQAVDLPMDLTGLEFLTHIGHLKGLSNVKTHALQIMDGLGLADDAGSYISAYSGGMRRRLITAQALLGQPKLLCLDEPTSELDAVTAGRVAQLILQYSQQAVVLVTSHHSDIENAAGAQILEIGG